LLIPFTLLRKDDLGWRQATQSRGGGEKTAYLYIYTCLHGRHRLIQLLPWALPAHAWSLHCCPEFHVSCPCPCHCLGCSPHSWLFFIWGSGHIWGREGVLPNLGSQLSSHCYSTSPSPIKQASQAWLYVVVALSDFFPPKKVLLVLDRELPF
jgi:hypothetical protein